MSIANLTSSRSYEKDISNVVSHGHSFLPTHNLHLKSRVHSNERFFTPMATLQSLIQRYPVSGAAPILRAGYQRRWARVHDVRFLATHSEPHSIVERYKEKLDKKAKEYDGSISDQAHSHVVE